MSTVFDLHDRVLDDYQAFIHAQIHVADAHIATFLEEQLLREDALWPEPLIQLSPAYRRVATVDDLAQRGLLHPETARIFRDARGRPFHLYQHQVEAIEKARRGESFVVTSGTGSGKTFAYFIPIVDTVVRLREALGHIPPGPLAFLVYPMNALVNSQLAALESLKRRYEEHTGKPFPVTFARYTGETREEARQRIRANPPHLLLTNYVMLELLMVRKADRPLRELPLADRAPFFLVFDELHTYRGRQGADVAMLVRRLKARLQPQQVIHIGTSATMVAHPQATPEERRQAVADFAARFFGHPFRPEDIIEETLEPVTLGGPPSREEVRTAFDAPFPDELDAFRRHPLVRWLEYALGLEREPDGHLRRRKPRTLSGVAQELAAWTDRDPETCRRRLQELLLRAVHFNRQAERPIFPFKLHQFISQGRAVYATLGPPGKRHLSLWQEGRQADDRAFYPLRFCRVCGQEYYYVVRQGDRFLPYPLGLYELPEDLQAGYLMMPAAEKDWSEDQIPVEWLDRNGRVARTWRDRVPHPVWVREDGTFSTEAVPGAHKAWWQPDRLWLCQNCGEYYTARESEYAKLASLSSEGRSSATTVLAVSLLRHAERMPALASKLLTFTDNRQDASLQAGHFNDFVHTAVLRAALYQALQQHGELTFDRLAAEVVRHTGLTLQDIAQNRNLHPTSPLAQDVWRTFEDLTAYRLYEDLRRNRRITHPNLEDVGLLRLEYRGLQDFAAREDLWQDVPGMADLPPEKRLWVLRALLDHFRYRFALYAPMLEREALRQLVRRAEQHLNEFWGLEAGGDLRPSAAFLLPDESSPWPRGRPYYKLSPRTALGRFLMEVLEWDTETFPQALTALLARLVAWGYLRTFHPRNTGHLAYQLEVSSLRWLPGDGTPPEPDPIYRPRGARSRPVNRFFQDFYRTPPQELIQLEAREHTAQVVTPGERQRRERRFRWSKADRQDPGLGRRLPYLVCSPTMELGIDIADLDLVHMRNVPPSPANYAQRSGRAGRQGQPGLIFTYCGAFSNHDQYFFRHREEMVAGSVRAPRLDLANEDLLRTHIHAEWLAQVGLSLGNSIGDLMELQQEDLPLREEVRLDLRLSPEARARLRERILRMLAFDRGELEDVGRFSEAWLDAVLDQAAHAFDRAFDRWRELYRLADAQLMAAFEKRRWGRTREEREQAERQEREAQRQLDLLLNRDTTAEESDFYPYRYLASEGFLPGYNFPALPVRAWVPRGQGEFITRSRTLALREFGPQNIVYHEGSKWEVYAFQAPPGGLERRLTVKKLCRTCGAFTEVHHDRCPVCQTLFDAGNSQTVRLMEMPNVRLRRRERITANEEERMRRGYALEVTYRFAQEGGAFRVDEGEIQGPEGALMRIRYAPAATLMYINHGWRARREEGFQVHLQTGELFTEKDLQELRSRKRGPQQDMDQVERVRLFVQVTQNLLLLSLADPNLHRDPEFEVTLMYALKRGMEHRFQLEEDELGVMVVGEGRHRALAFYESAEGSLGALRRLLEEPRALAEVAREALRVLHFDDQGRDQNPDCARACYECLLSYSNQLEAHLLNRHRVVAFLQALGESRTVSRPGGRNREAHLQWLRARIDPDSPLEAELLDLLAREGYRLPDEAQKPIPEVGVVADFFYRPNVLIFCDGPHHDLPSRQVLDASRRQRLLALGYRVITLRYDRDLEEQVRKYPEVFGLEPG